MKRLLSLMLMTVLFTLAASSYELDGNYFMLGHKHQLLTLVHYDKGRPTYIGIVGDDITGIKLDTELRPIEVHNTQMKTTFYYGSDSKVVVQTGNDIYKLPVPGLINVDAYKAATEQNIANLDWLTTGYHKNSGARGIIEFCTAMLAAANRKQYAEGYPDLFLDGSVFRFERDNSTDADQVADWAKANGTPKYDYIDYVTIMASQWKKNMPNDLYAWIKRMIEGVPKKDKPESAEDVKEDEPPTTTVGPPQSTAGDKRPPEGDTKPKTAKPGSKPQTPTGNTSTTGKSKTSQPGSKSQGNNQSGSESPDGQQASTNPTQTETPPPGFVFPAYIVMKFEGYQWEGYNARYEYKYDQATKKYKLIDKRVPAPGNASPAYRQRIVVWLDGKGWIFNAFKTSTALPYEAPREFSSQELKQIVYRVKPGASYTD
ncbi:MAG: hypothetical protein KBT10_03020 [Bacteroidales bacterium]|nr:hypothetical protein [Candidatus Sodaliphilus aphodohippi]